MNSLPVIDFHSHILPHMDDGSKSSEMSLQMLDMLKSQGVDIAAATPHFYGHRESLESFLARRERASEKLKKEIGGSSSYPKVILGSEAAFYSGLTSLKELDKLCIQNTNVLLLEMPFSPWTAYEYDAVADLCLGMGFGVVLAHYERYAGIQKNNQFYDKLLSLPLYVQINADSLLPLFSGKRWINMFKEGRASLIGSDCHNVGSRKPNINKARTLLRKKLGEASLNKIDETGYSLLFPEQDNN